MINEELNALVEKFWDRKVILASAYEPRAEVLVRVAPMKSKTVGQAVMLISHSSTGEDAGP